MTTIPPAAIQVAGDNSSSSSTSPSKQRAPKQARVLYQRAPRQGTPLYILLGDNDCDHSSSDISVLSAPILDYSSDSSSSTIITNSSSMILKRPPPSASTTTTSSNGRSSCLVLALMVLIVLVSSAISSDTTATASIPMTTLSNGIEFPLVGLGVGNLAHDVITERIEQAVASERKTVLIDTAHASKNEALVRTGITNGLSKLSQDGNAPLLPVHVVTKVWYTHLGYDRTIMAVKESLKELNPHLNSNIKVHILIHWPRCFDEIPWMDCEKEETELPQEVKDAGPPPHLDRDGAFLASWKALEDIYSGTVDLGEGMAKVTSIGVSNFALEDMLELEKHMRVAPHIIQGNIWSFLFDPYLVKFCQDNEIHFQAFNVVHGIFYDREFDDAPNAIMALNAMADQVSERALDMDKNVGANYTLPQVVFKWLVQNQVSVIPRTRTVERLTENSAVTIAQMPTLDELELETVQSAVAALLTREDIEPPMAEFVHRAGENTVMSVFWINGETGEEEQVRAHLMAGETYTAYTQKDHRFAVYYEGLDIRKEFLIHAHHGQHQRFDLMEDGEGEEL